MILDAGGTPISKPGAVEACACGSTAAALLRGLGGYWHAVCLKCGEKIASGRGEAPALPEV